MTHRREQPGPPSHDDLVAALRNGRDLPRPGRHRQRVQVTGVDPSLVAWADQARADLARRLGVDPEAIEIACLGPVTWSDAGCGCPDPDMAYVQVPVDGTYAALVVDAVTYHYHGGGRRGPFLCVD